MTPYSIDDKGLESRVEIFGRNMLNGTLRLAADRRWMCVHPMMRDPRVTDCIQVATHVAQNGRSFNSDGSYHLPLCARHAAGWHQTSDGELAGVRRLVWR